MQYQVSRDGQIYGPYTLEDLQRYVTSGNVLPTDLAKSEDMPNWLRVAQIIGSIPAAVATYATPSPYTPAYHAPTGIPYPDPPNLHWALILLFSFLTCGIFMLIYDLVQALWVKKVRPATKVVMYYLIFLAIEAVNIALTVGKMSMLMHGMREGLVRRPSIILTLVSLIVSLSLLVILIVYRFTMRSELELHFNITEPIGLRLGPVMTFFFGGLYFQYHFNRINEIKMAMRYRSPGI